MSVIEAPQCMVSWQPKLTKTMDNKQIQKSSRLWKELQKRGCLEEFDTSVRGRRQWSQAQIHIKPKPYQGKQKVRTQDLKPLCTGSISRGHVIYPSDSEYEAGRKGGKKDTFKYVKPFLLYLF